MSSSIVRNWRGTTGLRSEKPNAPEPSGKPAKSLRSALAGLWEPVTIDAPFVWQRARVAAASGARVEAEVEQRLADRGVGVVDERAVREVEVRSQGLLHLGPRLVRRQLDRVEVVDELVDLLLGERAATLAPHAGIGVPGGRTRGCRGPRRRCSGGARC